jgi:hypothetical protein
MKNRMTKKKMKSVRVKKEQTDNKLEAVTVRYRSGGLMKEKIMTFMILWDLPSYSEKISHHIQTYLSSVYYHIEFFYRYFQLSVEQTVPGLLMILLHHREY